LDDGWDAPSEQCVTYRDRICSESKSGISSSPCPKFLVPDGCSYPSGDGHESRHSRGAKPRCRNNNAARYSVRPFGPMAAAALQHIALGAPMVVAGTVKGIYDLALLGWGKSKNLSELPAK
jgi:hypothetical protein